MDNKDCVISIHIEDNGNILVEEENTIYELDATCMKRKNINLSKYDLLDSDK